jgi:hypothetical protein
MNLAPITRRRAGLAGRLGDLAKIVLAATLPRPRQTVRAAWGWRADAHPWRASPDQASPVASGVVEQLHVREARPRRL